ncbi:hypothetical protein AAG906_027873 [Vitis piasezkii]
MATPSQSQSSGRGEEDNFEWRQAIEKDNGKRETIESSPPGDRKVERRKRCITHSGLNVRASSSSAFKRPGGKLEASRSIYHGSQELSVSIQRKAS